MSKEMLINVSQGEECRIALVEDGKLEELYMERTSATSHVGNIYKGKVTNVEPSIQAAFIDFGLGRNGFLHISDLMPSYFGQRGEDITEAVGRKMSRRDRPPIQRCLRRGDDITVQIIKEGIGTKGPTLTTYISIPGRILVMMPGMAKFGISRKIEDEDERRRLRGILDSLKPIDEVGFIIRTAGVGKAKTEIERDLKYLTRLWENITKKLKTPSPVELYTEGDLVTRTVRDVWSTDVERIVVDDKDVAKKIKEFFKIAMPRTKNKVEVYEESMPLFHQYAIEAEIEQMYSRHVPLPSGGSLVIDSTEAIVAIDINSGKFREHADAETTAFRTDMEAADEIARQLKLRDLGGVIICDFIDLRFERHRRELEQKLHDLLKRDRAKTKVLRMSQFGIIEMTRQRMRPSLKRSVYFDCPHCKGAGLVKTPESMSLDVMRKVSLAIHDQRVSRVELTVCPDVATFLLNRKRAPLAELEGETEKQIIIKNDPLLALDEQRLQLFDTREGLVYLEVLGMSPHDAQQQRGDGNRGGARRGSRRDGRGAGRGRPDNRHGAAAVEEQDEEESGGRDLREDDEQRQRKHEAALAKFAPTPVQDEAPDDAPEEMTDDDAADEPNVVDVEDGNDPIGEAPGEIDSDDRRYGRGRGGRGQRNEPSRGARNNENRGQRPVNRPAQERVIPPKPLAPKPLPPKLAAPKPVGGIPSGGSDEQERLPNENTGEPRGRRRRRRRGRRGRSGQTPEAALGHQSGDLPLDDVAENPPHVDRPEPGNEAARPEPLEDEEDHEVPGPGNEKLPVPMDEEGPKKRRRRRGGRRHRARRERQGGDAASTNSDDLPEAPASAQEEGADEPTILDEARSAPRRVPPKGSGTTPKVLEAAVERTGSTDKHMMGTDDAEEDAVEPEPARRPRTYRDLDELPDYDE